jgi:hypothetical protein
MRREERDVGTNCICCNNFEAPNLHVHKTTIIEVTHFYFGSVGTFKLDPYRLM